MFSKDQDLLVFEPNLFRDWVFDSQQLAEGTADVSGATLSFVPNDNSLSAAGLAAGHVLTVSGLAYVVDELTADNEATIFRPPVGPSGALIMPRQHSGEVCNFYTFAHQLDTVHRRLLRSIGVEATNTPFADAITEAQIINTDALRPLECLGALELIFRAAGTGLADDHAANRKAAYYAAAFAAEIQRATAAIDTNNDGTPDQIRKLSSAATVRA